MSDTKMARNMYIWDESGNKLRRKEMHENDRHEWVGEIKMGVNRS